MLSTNKYRPGTPVLKTYWENLLYHFRKAVYPRFNRGKHLAVLFYPDFPSKRTVIWKALNQQRIVCTNNLNQPYGVAVFWRDTTFRKPPFILAGQGPARVLNLHLTDISKHRVDELFEKTFGYSTRINPMTYTGKSVVKSNLNAAHDGQIIECPIDEIARNQYGDDVIFQRVIDNRAAGDTVMDLRLPVLLNEFPFLYKKYRPVADRFSNTNTYAELVDVRDYIKGKELEQIAQFCNEIGLDYGELDLLRDKDNNQLYLVDVSCTPWGPPNHLPRALHKKAIRLTGETWKKKLFEKDLSHFREKAY